MDALNDRKQKYINSQLGIAGSEPDMELQWLHKRGATSPCLHDAWHEYLDLELIPQGSLVDRKNALLRKLGLTGARMTMGYEFLRLGDPRVGNTDFLAADFLASDFVTTGLPSLQPTDFSAADFLLNDWRTA